MRLIETDTNANKDINAAVSVGAYTATATRGVIVRLLADQVAGGGDYIAYVTVQLAGAGSHYRIIPLTTGTAAAALTAIGFVSIPVPVDTGDVLTVYIDGLAGDTTTPDVRVDFYEQDYLRPTVTGRTLDVAATGEAGIDLTNKLDTAGILPTVAAGAENGLPILSAALATSANVTQVKGATISDLDASGNVLAKLANTVTHGGSTAQLALKKITVANSDNQGVAFSLRGGNPISPGIAIELIRGDGSSGAGRIGGYIDGVNNGVSLATEAIHDINFDVTGLQAIADAGLLAPTPGTPADGSVYDLLADASSGLTAQQTADAVNNLAPTGTPAVGSIGSHLDAILNGLTGVGLLPLIYTVTVTGTATPIEGVTVEVYTEEACINCIRRGTTNSFGVVTFWLTTTGTYWLRREKDGVTFVNPDSEIVSA